MTTASSTIKLTYEDYLGFPEDGKRHELIDGEHHVTPAPLTKHQRISVNLTSALHQHCQHTQQGRIFSAPTDVVLTDTDVVQPDILFIRSERLSIITRQNIQGAPDLVIEILSATTRQRDERLKRTLYEQHGVNEYWIVDPELDSIKIYRLQEGRYGTCQELTLEDPQATLTTPLLPGFSLLLPNVFA
ncbi:MAG: restriction endonuclease [Nitrospirales bacterium]|nr:MAG: restriction endonuclease [Nitrospirales bacterium]